MRQLNLRGTALGDDGLVYLADMKELFKLDLSELPDVSSAGLLHLSQLSKLRWLNLRNTFVDDEGMQSLAQLPALEYVNLSGTNLTDAGVSKLADALDAAFD